MLLKRVEHIRLLKQSSEIGDVDGTAVQGALFQIPSNRLLVFLDISSISESMFLNILKGGMLRVFDLRVAPRFDIGNLTRARIFDVFSKHHIDYFDIPGSLSILSRYDVRLNPESVASIVLSKICEHETPGPNLFLFEDDKRATEFAMLLPRVLPAPAKKTWETLIPKDNPFTEAFLPGNTKIKEKDGSSG